MERKPVTSSSIASIGYDETSETLEIEFQGGVYQYYGVPSVIFNQMIDAESKGKFFHAYIKNRYAYHKM